MVNDIVKRNIKVEESTFIFLLHEEDIFDDSLFQEYIQNVRLITAENTEKEMIISIIETNGYIIRNALYHFLPEDFFVMKNYPLNMGDYVEQLHEENSRLLRLL